jgi:signal transduction histidine kinase
MPDTHTTVQAERKLTFRLLVGYRWISLLPPLLWLTTTAPGQILSYVWWTLAFAVGLTLLLTLAAAPINRGLLRHPWLLLFDLLASALLVWYTGAEHSPYYLYSLAPILAAAFFFGVQGGFLAASGYTLLYLPLTWLAVRPPQLSLDMPGAAGQVISFFLIGASFGYLSQLLQRLRAAHAKLADGNTELSRRNRDLDLLYQLTLIMQSSVDPAELQEYILRGLVQEIGYRRAVVGLYDEGRHALTGWIALEARPDAEEDRPHVAHTDVLPLDEDQGPLARALKSRQGVEVRNGEAPTSSPDINQRLAVGDHYIALPMNLREHSLGIILVDRLPEDQSLSQTDRLSLDRLAAHAGVALGSVRMCIDRAQREAVSEERNRIAADLHDSISQILYGLGYGLDACLQLLPRQPIDAQRALNKLYPMVIDAQAHMRNAIFGMWSDEVASDSFVAGLHRHIRTTCPTRTVALQIELPGDFDRWDAATRIHLYRIAQEALANAAKHADARQVIVALAHSDHDVELRVKDDGRGFNPHQVDGAEHLGLQSMAERVKWLGGTFDLHSSSGEGTTVTVTISDASRRYAKSR